MKNGTNGSGTGGKPPGGKGEEVRVFSSNGLLYLMSNLIRFMSVCNGSRL